MGDLYPNINDPTFNIKIAKKKEFYQHANHFSVNDVVEKSETLCSASFELSPHQQFVKNFLSINTPYNSLMLFHGLGTGKTCSAIGISEEMRLYMKQMGITKKIIIVASPNVQENFKQQLFDERKMEKVGGIWSMQGCSGKNFIDEINPVNLKGLSKDKIVKQVERLIKGFYLFMGYGEFANFISKRSNTPDEMSEEKREILKGRKLRETFENRMIIIDEVHNIRSSDNKKEKRVASKLDDLIKYVHPLRLVLLTATPMYNDPREIIWLINLMNKNDGRSTITSNEVFDKNGNFILDERGKEVGKELLILKARGYVSFVKGDNPYTFPYRIFPSDFKATESLNNYIYPEHTLLGGDITQGMEYMDLFCVEMGPYQRSVYKYIIDTIKEKQDTTKLAPAMMERFGYTILQKPLEALNMTYPSQNKTEMKEIGVNGMVGIEGLERTMKYKKNKTEYEYRTNIVEKHGRVFAQNHLGKYSVKLKKITNYVVESEGICLVYSQFLDGGVVPLALALEEMGCQRYGAPNLLKEGPKKKRNITYTMITGNEDLSPNNALAVRMASDRSNIDGSNIKIIIISRAGSEGLDFANIRQVHILEPWYNTNRLDQTIGRAIRNCSHKFLPFSKRNTMIFLYSTLLENNHEAADMYVYRVAEMKAILIGRVARVLKESAIDCLLNQLQQDTTEIKMKQKKKLLLSTGDAIMYNIGDKPFSQQCDYMEKCSYSCVPTAEITTDSLSMDTYFILKNTSLMMRIKDLFKEHYFFKKDVLVRFLQYDKPYSLEQINLALDKLVEDKTEIIEDRYKRAGRLVNVGDYYIYQPLELDNTNASLFERSRPIEYKRTKMILESSVDEKEPIIMVRENSASILNKFDVLFESAFTKHQKTKKSEKDWYKNVSNAIFRLEAAGMKRALIEEFIVEHIWDTATKDDKVPVLDFLFNQDRRLLEGLNRILNKVIDKKIITHKSTYGIYLQEGDKFVLYVWSKKSWKKGEKTDNDDFIKVFAKNIGAIIRNLSKNYGFIIPFKDTNELIFKTKVRDQKRQSGARCDQASKKETIKTLNTILSSITRKGVCSSDVFSDDVVKDIGNVELCCYTELVLRCYNHHNVNGNTWFVGPEYAQKIIDHLKN